MAPRPASSAGASQTTAKPTTKYVFRTFNVPGAGAGPFQGTVPTGILPNGTIVGPFYDSNSAFHAFVRGPRGTITTFDAPGAGTGALQGTAALGMNSAGAITGSVIDTSYTYHGFLRSSDGSFTLFDAPGAGAGIGEYTFLGTHGFNINSSGEIAGNYWDVNLLAHAFLRAPNGTITTFDAPGAGNSPGQGTFYNDFAYQFFYALNSAGTYTSGYTDANNVGHGFVRSASGKLIEFDAPGAGTEANNGDLPANQGTFPISINAGGEIAGSYVDANNVMHGFVRDKGGKFTTFTVPGQGTDAGQGVVVYNNNPAGAVAGWCLDANFVQHGFVRTPGGTFTTFDAPNADTVDAYYGTFVTGLNPAGLLTGYILDPNSVYRAFVAIPAIFAGMPGYTNCPGQSTAAITKQYGSQAAGATALSFPDVPSMSDAIQTFCGQ